MDITGGDSYQALLGNAGLHVYDIQLRGFGRSSHVSESPPGGLYPVWGNDVHKFAQALGVESFIYTGISHGSGVGWYVVLSRPQAVRAFISIVGAPHDRTRQRVRGIGVDGDAPPPFYLVPTSDPQRLKRREENARRMQERAARLVSPEEKAINPGKVFPELETNEQVAQRLSQVRVPTLLLNGAQDDLIPASMALLTATSVPGSKLVMYQDHSHTLAREEPERVVEEALLFLREINVLCR
jgi:pimeloyl-ACP methyl ester carboxylesterase